MHPDEQDKVKRLISKYTKIGEAEVGVQTVLPIQELSCDAGVQTDGTGHQQCNSHGMLLTKINNLEIYAARISLLQLQHSRNYPISWNLTR